MRFDTPVMVSLRVSSAMPVGDVVAASGTVTFLMLDDGAAAVALTRTITVKAASPNALRGIPAAAAGFQVSPPSVLNSIVARTPVMLSVEPLYDAFGADARAGAVTERVGDANIVSVALIRTW